MGQQTTSDDPKGIDKSKITDVLKLAELLGRGLDESPKVDKKEDGSVTEEVLVTNVGERKLHMGKVRKDVAYSSADSVQNYETIRLKCLKDKVLFEDLEFPAVNTSVFFSPDEEERDFKWMRPHEICPNPAFFVEGVTRFDVKQGELGNCWLLAAVASITLNLPLFHYIVPEDNSFSKDYYAGIFHFRFWQYGHWVDVVVDDRLPTINKQLMFMHSKDKNEFWSALFEKAYAKLYGSYEALKGGTTIEALEDFTGGVGEIYQVKKAPPNLFDVVHKAHGRGSFLGCSIEADPRVVEAKAELGLIRGHAYSITNARIVENKANKTVRLLRIRNPWGNEAEWKGAWGDDSKEWETLPDKYRKEMDVSFDADGEFWMSYEDFQKYFDTLEICNLSPDSLEDEKKRRWTVNIFDGSWVRGVTAGGCRNFLETFSCNPQYIIELDKDEADECSLIVALMQKNRRAQRKHGITCLSIGFSLFSLTDPSLPAPLPLEFFKYNASCARSPSFINMREVGNRFKLPAGKYVVVPSTYAANQEGEFLIRVFTEGKAGMTENDDCVGFGQVDSRIADKEEPDSKAAEKLFTEFFKSVAGEDMEVDWMELKQVLDLSLQKEFNFPGFSKDVCRSMVAMMDKDRSGKLGLDQFVSLWKSIWMWRSVFLLYDEDKSGNLCMFELRKALKSSGYHVNNRILESLSLRYGNSEGNLMFDDFIMCAVKIKCMIDIFKEKLVKGKNTIEFTMEDWVEKTLYA